jgi:hypothetical protein
MSADEVRDVKTNRAECSPASAECRVQVEGRGPLGKMRGTGLASG